MKKVLFLIVIFSGVNVAMLDAQKTNGLDSKIFGGPEFTYLGNGDNSIGKGIGLGFTGGAQVDLNFNKPIYLVSGLNIAITNINRWLASSPTGTTTQNDVAYGAEIPFGLGFNLSKKKYKEFYSNFTIVNNFNINSSHRAYKSVGNLEIQDQSYTNHFGFYTPGLKLELGHNFEIGSDKYCSVGLSGKYMMWNWNKTNTDQFRSLGIALTMGVIL